jgi:hypothetical protein
MLFLPTTFSTPCKSNRIFEVFFVLHSATCPTHCST